MREHIRYPNLQAIVDGKGEALYRFFIVPNDPVIMEKQPGEVLIEFLDLNLKPYRRALDAFNDLLEKIPSGSLFRERHQELARQIPETAFLLQEQGSLLAELIYSHASEVASEASIYHDPRRWHSAILRALEELRKVVSLQAHFHTMTTSCLDAQAKKAGSGNKRLHEIQTFYREYQGFTWKTTSAFAPIQNGHLDRSALIGLSGRETDEELLSIYQQSNPEGASIVLCHILESLEEVLWFDFVQVMIAGEGLRRCKMCGRYFLPADLRQLYCARSIQGGKTCKEIGAVMLYKKNIAGDVYLEKFERLRSAMYFRMARFLDKPEGKKSRRDLTPEQYADWLSDAITHRQRYIDKEVTGDAMLAAITPGDYSPKKRKN